MARVSSKENKSIYQIKREELGLTREKAGELLQWITPERSERIESGKSNAHPDEVVLMAEKYQCPHLCNYFCANDCEIGQRTVPELKVQSLSRIVLSLLDNLNDLNAEKDRLIKIAADGEITPDELADFVAIKKELSELLETILCQKQLSSFSFIYSSSILC